MNATRRDVLMMGGALAALPLLTAATRGAKGAGFYPWPLGVQLYSVKAELDQDFEGTLRKVAALGFKRVEAAGWHGRSPQAFRAAVEATGMRCDSAHVSMVDLVKGPEQWIEQARTVGVTYLICSSPKPDKPMNPAEDWIPGIMHAMTLQAWKENAATLNRMGAMAAKAGLRFGYHNHPAEFALYDGQRGYDVLLAETDPKLVTMELDLAWAAAGGVDPVALMRAHPGRFSLLHLKDVPALPPAGQLVSDFSTREVGRGAINWRQVLSAAKAAGVRGAYIEQEGPYTRPVFESLAISRDYLERL